LTWGLLHWGMVAGLAGVAIPVVIHFLNRRRATVVDWGAMQFLELGRRSRWRFQLSELILLAGRMLLFGLIALALSRPFWNSKESEAVAGTGGGGGRGVFDGQPRDVVLVIDGSDSMGRKVGDQGGGWRVADDGTGTNFTPRATRHPPLTTPKALALEWSKHFLSKLGPGDSVAVLVAKDRVRRLIAPASFDLRKVEAALSDLPTARGGSDLPMAIAEALRLLDAPGNPSRDIIVLTDGQRFAWRPEERARWSILRELLNDVARRTGVSPRIWAIPFGNAAVADLANASVGPLELSRGLITPHLPITVVTSVSNGGSGSITRTAELLVDGQPSRAMTQVVGPIPPGGKAPLSFKTSIEAPGSHALTVRLTGGEDALQGDDESTRAVEVTPALPVLLVDGEPGTEPLSGETDFLRAALAPLGAETIQIKARTVRSDALRADDLKDQRAIVLANVERLDPEQVAAIVHLLDSGGGVLVAPGDKVDAAFANTSLYQDGNGWLPAKLGALRGDADRRLTVAHPAPQTFIGPALAPFGKGDNPPLAGADLFAYSILEPAKQASVVARLDTGDPWIIERSYRRGRVAILAGPVDAEGGTLPVNPDFVPWAHELIFHLADADSGARNVRPGEPIVLELNPVPPADVATLSVTTPAGLQAHATVTRKDGRAFAQLDDTSEPGLYQVVLPRPPGGSAFATVAEDARESDLRFLEPAETAALARDWPLSFETEPDRLAGRLFASGRGGRHEIWRYLVLATLAGLCVEIWLTRQLVKGRGIAEMDADRSHAR
jgi:von Willebrand factor type A domain/Aerotolerance regulator N-terminal